MNSLQNPNEKRNIPKTIIVLRIYWDLIILTIISIPSLLIYFFVYKKIINQSSVVILALLLSIFLILFLPPLFVAKRFEYSEENLVDSEYDNAYKQERYKDWWFRRHIPTDTSDRTYRYLSSYVFVLLIPIDIIIQIIKIILN